MSASSEERVEQDRLRGLVDSGEAVYIDMDEHRRERRLSGRGRERGASR